MLPLGDEAITPSRSWLRSGSRVATRSAGGGPRARSVSGNAISGPTCRASRPGRALPCSATSGRSSPCRRRRPRRLPRSSVGEVRGGGTVSSPSAGSRAAGAQRAGVRLDAASGGLLHRARMVISETIGSSPFALVQLRSVRRRRDRGGHDASLGRGASGAIGTRLVPQLIDAGHRVIGTFSSPPERELLRFLARSRSGSTCSTRAPCARPSSRTSPKRSCTRRPRSAM